MTIHPFAMKLQRGNPGFLPYAFCFLLLLVISQRYCQVTAFAMQPSTKTIYDIPSSGWTSPEWNWGYASGSGHNCATICRQKYTTRNERSKLVEKLVDAPNLQRNKRDPQNFEEIKLILALAWQRGQWDGTDGGRGGYGEVLANMVDAQRYEVGDEEQCSRFLVQDMQDRFQLLNPQTEDLVIMQNIFNLEPDVDAARRQSSGLVLKAMKFVENGL
jgi:hypothetical protein